MKKIGMIVAVEMDAVLSRLGGEIKKIEEKPFEIWEAQRGESVNVYILKSGAGEILASAGTQYLITKFGVEAVVNFGIVGALTENLKKEEVCIVKSVVHYDYDTSAVDNVGVGRYLDQESEFIKTDENLRAVAKSVFPSLKEVVCASGDKFIADAKQKSHLKDTFGAEICEMESAGILLTANRNNVPALFIKAISDTLFGGAEEYHVQRDKTADICFAIVDRVILKL